MSSSSYKSLPNSTNPDPESDEDEEALELDTFLPKSSQDLESNTSDLKSRRKSLKNKNRNSNHSNRSLQEEDEDASLLDELEGERDREKDGDEDDDGEEDPLETVRKVVPETDDSTLPALTFRVVLIGSFLGAIGAGVAQVSLQKRPGRVHQYGAIEEPS